MASFDEILSKVTAPMTGGSAQRWEYVRVHVDDDHGTRSFEPDVWGVIPDDAGVMDVLNALGKIGWEVVSEHRVDRIHEVLLKRPLS